MTKPELDQILRLHAEWLAAWDTGRRAYLTGAYLAHAYLIGADLTGADLTGAYLTGADLTGAYLTGAYLAHANLAHANLAHANLTRANLTRANLADAKGNGLVIARTRILPGGTIIGWKQCNDGVIVKLSIPAEAPRSNAFGRKCRAAFVDVLEVIGAEVGITDQHGPRTEYHAGQRVTCDKWDDDFKNECSGGIHFFITREEAEAYA